MKISDFVHEALKEIVVGVTKAKRDTRNLASISPAMVGGKDVSREESVEFELSVTVTDNTERSAAEELSGGAEIKIVGMRFGIGGTGSSSEESGTQREDVSRVKFKVPVYFSAHHRADSSSEWDEEKKALDTLQGTRKEH